MTVQTSVGPIRFQHLSCGHSTTVEKGNMYSFLATAASGDAAVHDRRPQVARTLLLDQPRAVLGGHVGDAGLLQVLLDLPHTAVPMPGTVNAARPAFGSSGGSASIGPSRSASAWAISFVCREAQMPEQLMQPRPVLR